MPTSSNNPVVADLDSRIARHIAAPSWARRARDEIVRLEELNAELLKAVESAVDPLHSYHAYGWPDRNGVILNLEALIAKARER